MISIIDYFKKNSLSYTATGPSGSPSSGFLDNTYFYTEASDPYWQVEFQLPVTIEKYFFTYTCNSDIWPTSWKISYSLDCSTFTELQTDAKKLQGNTENFSLKNPVYCKCFKITGLTTSTTYVGLWFSSFKCYGSLKPPKMKDENTFFHVNAKRRFLIIFIRSLLVSILSS